jgi:hypothetical protein
LGGGSRLDGEGSASRLDDVVADRADQVRSVEQPTLLLRREPIPDVSVVEDVVERTAAVVLAHHIRAHAVLHGRASEEKGERISKKACRSEHEAIVSSVRMRPRSAGGRFAERVLHGVDDIGAEERIVIWIERKPGAVWAVGRAVNPQHRPTDEPRAADYLFEGHELEDALQAANECLEDDLDVSEKDGRGERIVPFTRNELLKPLERWFFGRKP